MEPLQADDPQQVGRYRLVGRLGLGGMGRVYAAAAPDGRRAAVKVIRDDLADDTGFRRRFRREVAAASAVAGLFTARVLDADPDGDPPWLATEFVEGPSVRDAVLRNGPMPEPALLDLARGLAEALGAIHAAGLVHRDLKAANVLLSPTGPRVIDFGIARVLTASARPATADPDSPQARYVDRLCASGTLLSTLGDTAIAPRPGTDPAQLKRDYLAAADRTIGTVEAALPDLTVLRDEAPTPQIRGQFGLIVAEFDKARDAFTTGRGRVAAAEPLTVAAYTAGVDSYLDGTRSLALAATLVKGVTLPSTYTAASATAPHCGAT